MSDETPLPATLVGGERVLLAAEREAAALRTQTGAVLTKMERELAAPLVFGNLEQDDLPGEVTETALARRAARVTGAARRELDALATRLEVQLAAVEALGRDFGHARFVREAALKADPGVQAHMQASRDVELVTHLREGVARGDLALAASAAVELGRREGVPMGLRREAEGLLERVRFPAREKLLAKAEETREQLARTRVAMADVLDGPKASATKLYWARHHLPLPPWPADGQPLEVRPGPAPIWGG